MYEINTWGRVLQEKRNYLGAVQNFELHYGIIKEHGAKIVEGYPIEAKESNLPSVSSFTGIMSAFAEAGFVEVLRRSEHRPIMRYFIEEQ